MTTLPPTIQPLERELAEIEAGSAAEASAGRIVDVMEEWVAHAGGAHSLVERFAGSQSAIMSRAVAFILARCTSWRRLGARSGPLVLRAIERRQVADAGTQANLLTAIQLSEMYDELLTHDEPMPQLLMDFLLECSTGTEDVQATLMPVIGALYGRGVLARAPRPADVATLRARMLALDPEPESLLELEWIGLAPFLFEDKDPPPGGRRTPSVARIDARRKRAP